MNDTFFGVSSNGWIAIAGLLYALATLILAFITNCASVRAVRSAQEIANSQNEATSAGIERQISSSAEGIAAQIRASEASQERHFDAMKEAATIQARATSISNNRQGWINALRDEVTSFLTSADIALEVREMRLSEEREVRQHELVRSMTSNIFKVRLLINPTEGDSTNLVEMMRDIERHGLTSERRETLVTQCQTILKTEWERVKSGE